MGWRRYFSFMRHRLGRMQGTPHSIAAGFASGAALSVTPFMGVHFLLSAMLAWIVRGNILASAIGTLLGNPWTFPLFFYWTYKIGCLILGLDGLASPFQGFVLADILRHPYQTLEPVIWPMMVGSVPFGFVVWWLFYWPLHKVIAGYKRQRLERRHRRALDLMKRMKTEDNAAPAGPAANKED